MISFSASGRPRVAFARAFAAGERALRLYAILDAGACAARGLQMMQVARIWRDVGVRLLQYRDKTAGHETLLENASKLRALFPAGEAFLLLNDHPELVRESGCDGVHLGQGDGSIEEARSVLGEDAIVGRSTHTVAQAESAAETDVDYIAIGPVFATSTKPDAEPVVGLCGVQAARAVIRKPLVAIGGVDAANAQSVLAAGAGSIAMISGLLPDDGIAACSERARDFLERFA